MQLAKRHFSSRSKAFIASLLAGLVLLLDAMAVSPALHELAHKDAGQSSHQCVVTMFAQGQVDAADVVVTVPVPSAAIEFLPSVSVSVVSTAVENLPPGRAPPVSSCNS